MIQVFKGVALNETNKLKNGMLQLNKQFPPAKKQQSKELKGWEQQPVADEE